MSRQVQATGRPRRVSLALLARLDGERRLTPAGLLGQAAGSRWDLSDATVACGSNKESRRAFWRHLLGSQEPRDDTSALLQRRHTEDVAPQLSVLAVGDPRRPLIRRAVFGTIWAAAVFFVFTATKEVKTVYGHSPWLNDPYDTVISFTMFFVPLVTACLLVQVSLCLRSEPLPAARVVAIVRACRVAVGAIVVDLASAWLAVSLGANELALGARATGLEVGLLGLATSVATTAVVHLVRVPRLPGPAQLDVTWSRLAQGRRHRRQTREPALRPAPPPGFRRRRTGPTSPSYIGPPPPRWRCGFRQCCLWRDSFRVAGLPGGLLPFCDAAGHGPGLLCDVRLPRPRWLLFWPCTQYSARPTASNAG